MQVHGTQNRNTCFSCFFTIQLLFPLSVTLSLGRNHEVAGQTAASGKVQLFSGDYSLYSQTRKRQIQCACIYILPLARKFVRIQSMCFR